MMEKIIQKLNSVNLKVAAFAIGICVGIAIGVYQPPAHEYNYEEIVVQPGDTLWDLTRSRSGTEINIQELIHATNEKNGIKGNLVPGQRIQLAVSIKK